MDAIMVTDGIKQFLNADNKLKQLPKKRDLQILSLFYLASKFTPGKRYTEKDVNETLNAWHTFDDWAILRRYLCECGFLIRSSDGAEYRLAEPQPEMPEFEEWIRGKK